MFDFDQDKEILAVIQAAHRLRYNLVLSTSYLTKDLYKTLDKVEEKYGKEIFTYTGA